MRPHDHTTTFTESQQHVINPTNPRRALDDGVKHRLHICRRTADDAEHLGGCGLMFQRLPQFNIALLDLFEEPYILDGDDCLVRERLEERHLLLCKRIDLYSPNQNDPQGNALTE